MDIIFKDNPITCATSVLDDAVLCVGTLYGSLMVLEVSAPSTMKKEKEKKEKGRGVGAYHLVSSRATHAFAVRSVDLCPTSLLVATASDDATVVVQPLSSLLSWEPAASQPPSPQTIIGTPSGPYPLRVRGLHTLPISCVSWIPGTSLLASTSYDGKVAIFCAASHSIVNKISVGFPLSTICLSTTDVGVLWVAGRGVARIDLLAGCRIHLPGALSTQLAEQRRVIDASQAGAELTKTVVMGVDRMLWCCRNDESNTVEDLDEEEWSTHTTYVTRLAYDAATHALSAYIPVTDGSAKILRWKLRATRWKVAEPRVGSTEDCAEALSPQSRETMRLKQLLSSVAVGNIASPASGQHGLRSFPTVPLSSWSLGYASWYRPLLPARGEGEGIRSLPCAGLEEEVTVPDRKRQRKEETETPQSRQLEDLRAKMEASQSECDALAATLKALLQSGK